MAGLPINCDIVEALKLFEKDIRFSTCPKYYKKNLEKEMEDLKKARDVVTTIVRQQERTWPGTECEDGVESWLKAVDSIDTEVDAHLKKLAESRNCTCCCFPCQNHALGKEVERLIEQVRKWDEERRKFNDAKLVRSIPFDPSNNVPDLRTKMVGRDGKSSEIYGYLRNSQVTTIGIWGRGGIGKTTMLKSIKQWLSGNDHGFPYIIWVEMSQNDDDILKIQKQIASSISLSPKLENEESENARTLDNVLRSKKSLILIDNVWKELEFERIGIPLVVDFVKILFTTRSEGVCNNMRAQKIVRLDSLDEKESLQLFQANIRNDVVELTDKIVHQRVDEILKICGGLPLFVVTVAKSVANYNQDDLWHHAVKCLRSSPEEIEGMDEVMKRLKFSYDALEDDKIKSCLLYLSLYPEGYQIYTDLLIKQCLAEGFLDKDDTPNDNSFTISYGRGVVNISKLKSICLVEKSVYSDDCVKLHNEIRHMLCWIRKRENKEVFIVYTEVSDCNYDRWDLAKRIFLFEGQLKRLPETGIPSCRNLRSLHVQAQDYYPNRIGKLPTEEFFHFTPSLRVLDLSGTGLVDIPKSIGQLVELRYLNLNGTRIHTVPMELANLKKLKCLDLGDTIELVTIVGSAISQLSALQWFNLFNTSYQWKSDDVNMTTQHPLLKLEDLRELKNLEDLGVDVWSTSHLDTILCNQMLLKSIARISFIRIDFTTIYLGGLQLIEWISQRLPELKDLIVDGCALAPDIIEIEDDQLQYVTQLCLRRLEISSVTLNDASRPFSRLKKLQIFGCRRLKELSWTAHIPSLEMLIVNNCYSVKELVDEEEEEEEEEIREERHYFPKLYLLKIENLKNLERIHGRSHLLFAALRFLFIENCPKLKQLSFGNDSAKNMEYIKCEKTQWDLLEWENDQVQEKFSPYVHWISPIPSDPIDNDPDLFGKEVVRLIDRVHLLVEERRSLDDDNLVRPILPDTIHNVPDLPTTMIGRDGESSEIHDYLRDSEVTTIGIWGRGGIGKTTLMLKSIKQWLCGNDHDFGYIIWIEMFKNDDDILKIQKRIASCIFLTLPSEHDELDNARMLANALLSKKSLVLIDNVWKKPAFEKIGIPFAVGTTVVKILFTTRSDGVCNDMTAQKIVRLGLLKEEAESLELFKRNISPVVDLTEKIVRLRVDEILRRCGGLPLVIVTVARTVANYTRDEEWVHAVESLKMYGSQITGEEIEGGCFKLMDKFPKKNKENLEKQMEYLKMIRDAVSTKIREQERTGGTQCKVVVKRWLDDVNGIETEVKTLVDDLNKTISCTCCFPCHNYFLGKGVVPLIDRVDALVEERWKFDDDNLVRPIVPDTIHNVPDLPTTMIGRDGKSSEIRCMRGIVGKN